MTTVRELFVKLGVKADNAELKKFDAGLAKMKQGMVGLAKVSAIATAAATGVYVAMSRIANANDDIAKTSRALGFATESLQKWQYAAGLGGVRASEFAMSMRRFSSAAYDAAVNGLATYSREFDRLGVSLKDSHGNMRETGAILLDISDKFKSMPDGIEKTAIATKLFGRSGARFVNMMNNGSQSLLKTMEQMNEMGAIVDPEALKASEAIIDAQLRLKMAFRGVTNILFKEFAPIFLRIVKAMKEFVVHFRKAYVETGKFQKALKVLAVVAGGVLAVFAAFSIASIFGGAIMAVNALASAISMLGTAGLLANAKLLLIPILLGVGIASWAAMFQDLYKTITCKGDECKNTVFGTWKKQIDGIVNSIKTFIGYIKKAKNLVSATIGGDKNIKETDTGVVRDVKMRNKYGIVGFVESIMSGQLNRDLTNMMYGMTPEDRKAFGAPQINDTKKVNINARVNVASPEQVGPAVMSLEELQLQGEQ